MPRSAIFPTDFADGIMSWYKKKSDGAHRIKNLAARGNSDGENSRAEQVVVENASARATRKWHRQGSAKYLRDMPHAIRGWRLNKIRKIAYS